MASTGKAAWLEAGLVWDEIADATDEGIAAALEEIGIVVHRMIVTKLSFAGGGATYTRGGVSHTASAPGEPPAVDTGQYRASWAWKVLGGQKAVEIFTDQERGPWLEFGTSRMAPRPHVRPVMEEASTTKIAPIVRRRIVDAQKQIRGKTFAMDLVMR